MPDLPRKELMARADEVLNGYAEKGIDAVVFFKVTCPNCGNRIMFRDPNTWYDSVDCIECGKVSPVTGGGFMLAAGQRAKVLEQIAKEERDKEAHSS